MPEWLTAVSQVSLSAALAVFGLVLLLSPHERNTILTNVVVPTVWFVSAISMLHYFVSIPGWPLLAMGSLWWLITYAAYKHLSQLARSANRAELNHRYGRRNDD
jgi:hypothetical protein